MRRAPRHPGRFTPAVQSLEGRLVLSYGLAPGPPIAILPGPASSPEGFDHPGDATDAPGSTVGIDPAKVLSRIVLGTGSVAFPGRDAATGGSPFASSSNTTPAAFSYFASRFGFGRDPGGPWGGWGRPQRDASSSASDDGFVGPPAPESGDSQALASSAAATPPRGGDPGFARLGPYAPPQAGPGPAAPQPNEYQSRPTGAVPRGVFAPPIVIDAAASPAAPASPAPAAPGPPPPAAAGSPDLARPLTATNVAWGATVASLNLGASGPAGERVAAPGMPATVLETGDGNLAAASPGPRSGAEPQAVPSARAEPATAEPAPPAEAPAPIGSGVLTAFLPLDRATVDLALEKVMGQLDDLGSPLAGPSSRLPLAVPVAAALAAAEAARRWRARTSLPGPSVARGSRFSSLRGLS